MRLVGKGRAAVVGSAVLGSLLVPTADASPSQEWERTPVPMPDNSGGVHELAAIAPNDVWALSWGDASLPEAKAHHWDGNQWVEADLPQPQNWKLSVSDVDAAASDDVWALATNDYEAQYFLHWNGQEWTRQPALPEYPIYRVSAVKAFAPDNVWLAGSSVQDGSDKPHALVLHWDGHSWEPANTPSSKGRLMEMEAAGPNDIWAAGYEQSGDRTTPLLMHWDGTIWQKVEAPPQNVPHWELGSLALTNGQVWAIPTRGRQAVHVDASGVHAVDYPKGDRSILHDVVSVGDTVRAVGEVQSPDRRPDPLVLEWRGDRWVEVPAPPEGKYSVGLWAAATTPGTGEFWVSGYETDSRSQFPYAAHTK